MALLVCFHNQGKEVDWSNKAIYLEQDFYESLLGYYKKSNRKSTLREMVSIGYNDEYILRENQINEVLNELTEITDKGNIEHGQIQPFANILREAASKMCSLAIGGDMYPDLSQKK